MGEGCGKSLSLVLSRYSCSKRRKIVSLVDLENIPGDFSLLSFKVECAGDWQRENILNDIKLNRKL